MNNQIIRFKRLIIAGILLFLFQPLNNLQAEGSKSNELRRKMAEISLLHDQLTEKKEQAFLIRERLYHQLEEYVSEIKIIIKKKKITTYQNIGRAPRIGFNLKLIAEQIQYRKKFDEKILFYQIGTDKLEYLYQQADDDLKMVNTLNDLKIEALLSQIKKVLEQYITEAHKIIIDHNTFNIIEPEKLWPEKIWNDIIKGKSYL